MKQEPKRDETEYLLSTEANRNRLLCKDCNKSLEDCTCIENTIELPKQETTLDEAKLRQLFKNRSNCYIENIKEWQQERSYSEEDMLNFAWFLIKNVGQYSDDRMAHFEGKYLEQFKKK